MDEKKCVDTGSETLAAKLVVCGRDGQFQSIKIEKQLTFGRKGAGQGLPLELDSPYVSDIHGGFVRDEEGCRYQDVSRAYHTYINGRLFSPDSEEYGTPVKLKDGDVIAICGDSKTSQADQTDQTSQADKTDQASQADQMSLASQPGQTDVVLIYRSRYDELLTWRAVDLEAAEKDVYISSFEESCADNDEVTENHEVLTAKHYAILRRGESISQNLGQNLSQNLGQASDQTSNLTQGGTAEGEPAADRLPQSTADHSPWTVLDHSTRFGVYVNNQKVTDQQPLRQKDVLRIGNTIFLYQNGRLYCNHKEYNQNKLSISIRQRSVWNLFRKRVLLQDINLEIHPGEMVLILGGSGAGKTTFMNAVMGYEKAKGTIKEGDRDLYKDYSQLKYDIGFVPQQDLLRLEDTVYDTLKNSADMKLPGLGPEEKKARILAVLEVFGLEQEQKSLVEKLSGGQRKRLSIAVEFIADPKLFFLDEPDSGLDGAMARSLMENLRKIADQQKIVLVITHTPDRVDDLFDKVLVLAKDSKKVGRLAFYGSIEEAHQFFETDTLEEIVHRVNRVDEGGDGKADFYIEKYEKVSRS